MFEALEARRLLSATTAAVPASEYAGWLLSRRTHNTLPLDVHMSPTGTGHMAFPSRRTRETRFPGRPLSAVGK